MTGLSTIGSISFGTDFVAGRKRVPRPAAGMTALRTGLVIEHRLLCRNASADYGGTGKLALCFDWLGRPDSRLDLFDDLLAIGPTCGCRRPRYFEDARSPLGSGELIERDHGGEDGDHGRPEHRSPGARESRPDE